MKIYHVEFEAKVIKELKKMDRFQARIIRDWIKNNLEGTDNPRIHGKGLVENHSGEWRYRVGDYRILANIVDDRVLIQILRVGHRRDTY